MSSDKLSRLLIGLKIVGVEKGERNKTVAKKTGYALGTITRILSGNAALTDRFIQAVCSAFGVRKEWIEKGEKPVSGFDIKGLEGVYNTFEGKLLSLGGKGIDKYPEVAALVAKVKTQLIGDLSIMLEKLSYDEVYEIFIVAEKMLKTPDKEKPE